jgi:hypothetical protein
MSVVYDGLIGGVRMIDDPMIAQNVEAYQGGNISFEDLRDIVVNKYMEVLVANSKQGFSAKQPKGNTGTGGNKNSKDSADADDFTPDQKTEIDRLLKEGYSNDQIADYIKTGIDPSKPWQENIPSANYGVDTPKFDPIVRNK